MMYLQTLLVDLAVYSSMAWLIGLFLCTVIGRTWAWIDDSKYQGNLLINLIMTRLGYKRDKDYSSYWVNGDVEGPDWGVVIYGFAILMIGPLLLSVLVCIWPITLTVAGLVALVVLLRILRRRAKANADVL